VWWSPARGRETDRPPPAGLGDWRWVAAAGPDWSRRRPVLPKPGDGSCRGRLECRLDGLHAVEEGLQGHQGDAVDRLPAADAQLLGPDHWEVLALPGLHAAERGEVQRGCLRIPIGTCGAGRGGRRNGGGFWCDDHVGGRRRRNGRGRGNGGRCGRRLWSGGGRFRQSLVNRRGCRRCRLCGRHRLRCRFNCGNGCGCGSLRGGDCVGWRGIRRRSRRRHACRCGAAATSASGLLEGAGRVR
jgi:hypothetical protein